MACLSEGTVELPDRRRLGFAEYGIRGGIAVFHFHGWPGGRFYDMAGRALAETNAWMLTLERPGVGISDPQPGRQLLDWPNDVAAFADRMGIERFAVVGTSAGAPYALACSYQLADRVPVVGLQCGFCPLVEEPSLDHLLPDDWRDAIQRYRSDPDGVLGEDAQRLEERAARWANDQRGLFIELFGEPVEGDRQAYEQFRGYWMRILAATYGTTPSTDEYRIIYEPWGFAPGDVTAPVHAWHGDSDESAPVGLIEAVVERLPNAALTVYPGEGHYLSASHHAEMLTFLTSWS